MDSCCSLFTWHQKIGRTEKRPRGPRTTHMTHTTHCSKRKGPNIKKKKLAICRLWRLLVRPPTVSSLRSSTLTLRPFATSHGSFWGLRAVTPSEVRTLKVSSSGHYTFGKLHLQVVLPSEYYTFESYTFGSFTFGNSHLRDITTLQNYTFQVSENGQR